MRAPHRNILPSYMLLASLLSTSRAITLSQFQQVSGFSQACTDAYNTPLTGCVATDFINGNACSSGCIEFLEKLTIIINKACKGTIARPNTLIGMFFSGEAVATLCPNVQAGWEPLPSAAGGDGDETGSIVAVSTSCTSSVTSLKPTVAESLTPIATPKPPNQSHPLSSTPASSGTPPATSSVLVPLDTSTTMTMATGSDSTPTVLPPESTIPLSVLTGTASKSGTAQAQSTSSSTNNNGNPEGDGGGTLFDLTSSSCRIARTTWWVASIPAGVFMLSFLL